MKLKPILVATLAAGSVFAQAPDKELDARIQVFGEVIRPLAITINDGTNTFPQAQANRSMGLGLRFMGELAAAHHWYYELGGKLDSSSNLNLNNATVNLTDIKVTHSYLGVGAGYLVPLGQAVSLGFHVEGRGEVLSAQGAAYQAGKPISRADASNSFLRPWVRLSLDGSFHLGTLHPFIGADVAATPVKTSQTTPISTFDTMDNRTLRAMAPTSAASFYLGLHF